MSKFAIFTALLTPLLNGEVDCDSLENLLELQQNGEVDGVVALGTTAENTLLSEEEKTLILKIISKRLNGKKFVVGIGDCSTKNAVKNALIAKNLGADAVMAVTPYFTRYTEGGLLRHFEEIYKAAKLPIVLYNVPYRTGIDLPVETILKIADVCNVAAVKEASTDLSKTEKLAEKLPIFSGNDLLIEEFRKSGAKGAVCSGTNVLPIAESCPEEYLRFCKTLQCEINPVAIKYAAFRAGIIKSPEMRLPLTPLSQKKRGKIDEYLREKCVR